MHQRMFMAYPVALRDDDGHCFAPAHRDGDILHADRDRIASDDALVQDLDLAPSTKPSSIKRLSSSSSPTRSPRR